MRSLHRSALLAGFASISFGASAAAQATPEATLRRQLIDRGIAARDAGQHAQALELFLRAGRVQMRPGLRMSIAQEHQALGHVIEACESASLCVGEAQADVDGAGNNAALQGCASLVGSSCANLGRLRLRLPPSAPDDLRVVIEGRTVDVRSGADLFAASPGRVSLQAFVGSRLAFEQGIPLRRGETREVRLNLRIATVDERPSGSAVDANVPPRITSAQGASRVADSERVDTAASEIVTGSPPATGFERFVFDGGIGLGLAAMSGRPSYAEQRLLVDSAGNVIARNCGDVVCYQTIDAGLAYIGYVHFGARFQITRVWGIGANARVQWESAPWTIPAAAGGAARSNPFANMLFSIRGYAAVVRAMNNELRLLVLAGTGYGQIEAQPALPSSDPRPGAHVLSGYFNAHAGVRLEWAPLPHFHMGAEAVAQVMVPTFLFDMDFTTFVGFHL